MSTATSCAHPALTITHAHRTALRRIARGEPIGDLAVVLGALYLHDLVRDDDDGLPELTDNARGLLAAHDAIAELSARDAMERVRAVLIEDLKTMQPTALDDALVELGVDFQAVMAKVSPIRAKAEAEAGTKVGHDD